MRVRLLKPHTHAGRDYPIGAEPDLPNHTAEWLLALKCAEEIPPATPAKAKTDKGAKA